MRIKESLFAIALCSTLGNIAAADTLVGQVPIGIRDTFTMQLTGCTTTTTGTAHYVKNTVTGVVTLNFPAMTCTAAGGVFPTFANLPTEILPSEITRVTTAIQWGANVYPAMLRYGLGNGFFEIAIWNGSLYVTQIPPAGTFVGIAQGSTITYLAAPDT